MVYEVTLRGDEEAIVRTLTFSLGSETWVCPCLAWGNETGLSLEILTEICLSQTSEVMGIFVETLSYGVSVETTSPTPDPPLEEVELVVALLATPQSGWAVVGRHQGEVPSV